MAYSLKQCMIFLGTGLRNKNSYLYYDNFKAFGSTVAGT